MLFKGVFPPCGGAIGGAQICRLRAYVTARLASWLFARYIVCTDRQNRRAGACVLPAQDSISVRSGEWRAAQSSGSIPLRALDLFNRTTAAATSSFTFQRSNRQAFAA